MASLQGVNFYSRGSSPTYYLNSLSSWRTERGGGGYSPSSFTADNQIFVVQNGHTLTATAQWTVSGANSHVQVENGGQITTGAYNHQITGTVFNGGTYEVTHDTYSNLGWGGNGVLETNSNFILNNSGISFNDNVSYGNLIVQQGTADCLGGTEGFEVKGTLRLTGGIFEGGQTTDQVLSIANISVESGYFYGSTGAAQVTFNISGNVSVSGGYWWGSEGSGACTYNIGGDLSIGGGFFYGVYRSSSTLPSNTYNIGGSFTKTGGSYYAVNRVDVGYPSYYLSGTGKNLGLGDLGSDTYARHFIQVNSGASYTLTNHVPVGSGMQCYVRGTLTASSTHQFKALGSGVTFRVHGTLITPNVNGLCYGVSTTFANANSPAVDLWSGCTVQYSSASSQAVTARTDYSYLTLSGAGLKSISGATVVASAFTIGSPLAVSTSTSVNGSLAVNAGVSLSTGITLYINGSMSGSSTITGGNVTIGGTSAQLSLGSLNVDNLTLNRASGSLMYASVQTANLLLSQGSFGIGANTLIIYDTMSGSGTLTGGTGSNLTVAGTASAFPLPSGLVLNTLTLSRPNGASLAGNLSVTDLSLLSGALNVGANTLSLGGTTNWLAGSLNMGASSTLIAASGPDGTLYPIQDGTLTVNRSGRTVYLGGNTQVLNLNLSAGTLALSDKTLTVTGSLSPSGGSLSGGNSAHLAIAATASGVTVPSVTLGTYTQQNSLVYLGGNLQVNTLDLQSGTLDLGNYSLIIYQGVARSQGRDDPFISGSTGSSLQYISSGDHITVLPKFSVGSLSVDCAGICRVGSGSNVFSGLSLLGGELDPNSLLTLEAGCAVNRLNGFLASAPTFSGAHRVFYMATCTGSWELAPTLTQEIGLMAPGIAVELDCGDIFLLMLRMMPNTTLVLDPGTEITLLPGGMIMDSFGSVIFGRVNQDIMDQGFSSIALGISLDPGVMVTGFSVEQQPQSQTGKGEGILRTWSLEGIPEGQVNLSFSWDPSADNGIEFSPSNLAIVYRHNGMNWQQTGDPQDVSGLVPRVISVQTDEFSQWTVGAEDSTLPVELSSFTAAVTGLHSVTLTWVTQSETNLLGYYLYRNTGADFDAAVRASPLIPASNTSSLQVYSYTDPEQLEPGNWYYWLQSLELDGGVQTFNHVSVLLDPPQGVPQPPADHPVLEAYPNPFNPDLGVRVWQKASGPARLEIYDLRGSKVRELFGGYLEQGLCDFHWDSLDEGGLPCASGTYLLVLASGGETHLRRITLLK
jgi:hypothetical protein